MTDRIIYWLIEATARCLETTETVKVWPIRLWPILIFYVADMVFCCGRYRLAVANASAKNTYGLFSSASRLSCKIWLWPIWSHCLIMQHCMIVSAYSWWCGSLKANCLLARCSYFYDGEELSFENLQTSSCVVVMHSCKKWYVYCVWLLDKMPCWYFERSELENTPSFRNGVDAAVEERYRREGAKLIIDTGSALGLYLVFVSYWNLSLKKVKVHSELYKYLWLNCYW